MGIIGTYERYLAMLLEQTKGALPLWLSPNQIQILPVNPSIHGEYANKLNNEFLQLGYRSEVDGRDERLAKRIREAQISKIPYQLIIGDEEVNNENLITFRCYGEQEDKKCTLSEFKKILSDRIESKK